MSSAWLRIGCDNDGLPLQIVPENDLRDHDQDPNGVCPCMPRLIEDGAVVVHNAYDAREVGEVCRRALDMLGVQLTRYSHQWSERQRDAYEHALALLEMHWPSPADG